MLSYDDPDVEGDETIAAAEILGYAMMLADQRRSDPQDDIITKLVSDHEDGYGTLTDDAGAGTGSSAGAAQGARRLHGRVGPHQCRRPPCPGHSGLRDGAEGGRVSGRLT